MSKSLGSQIMSLKTKRSQEAAGASHKEVSEDEYIAFLTERENQKARRVRKIQDYLNGKRSLKKGENED